MHETHGAISLVFLDPFASIGVPDANQLFAGAIMASVPN
jgi:hypothetical protein